METETAQMVYAGQTEGQGRKLLQQWIEVGENNGEPLPADSTIRLYAKLERHAIIGVVYEFNVVDRQDDRLKVGTPGKWVGQWKNEQDRQRWQLENRLIRTVREARKEFLPDDLVNPIREVYQRTPAFQKTAFLAWLIQSLQKKASPR